MESIIRRLSDLDWVPLPGSPNVSHKELLSREESASLDLKLWRVLFEKIEPGAAVLPHYHDVTEVIHFVRGEVHVLLGEQRSVCQPGDSLVVRSGVVHSVANKGSGPSTQVSFFIPGATQVEFGRTEWVSGVEI
ncbi:MAG: cupin domain-containing protein [bacterium]